MLQEKDSPLDKPPTLEGIVTDDADGGRLSSAATKNCGRCRGEFEDNGEGLDTLAGAWFLTETAEWGDEGVVPPVVGSPALRIFDSTETERRTPPCLALLDAAAIEELSGYEEPLMSMEVILISEDNGEGLNTLAGAWFLTETAEWGDGGVIPPVVGISSAPALRFLVAAAIEELDEYEELLMLMEVISMIESIRREEC